MAALQQKFVRPDGTTYDPEENRQLAANVRQLRREFLALQQEWIDDGTEEPPPLIEGPVKATSVQIAEYLGYIYLELWSVHGNAGGTFTDEMRLIELPSRVLDLAVQMGWLPEPEPGEVWLGDYPVTKEFHETFLKLLFVGSFDENGNIRWTFPNPAKSIERFCNIYGFERTISFVQFITPRDASGVLYEGSDIDYTTKTRIERLCNEPSNPRRPNSSKQKEFVTEILFPAMKRWDTTPGLTPPPRVLADPNLKLKCRSGQNKCEWLKLENVLWTIENAIEL